MVLIRRSGSPVELLNPGRLGTLLEHRESLDICFLGYRGGLVCLL